MKPTDGKKEENATQRNFGPLTGKRSECQITISYSFYNALGSIRGKANWNRIQA